MRKMVVKGSGGSSSSRGRSYGLMLLLAFGAALLGVMALHKLRERRVVTLLIKEKDRDILSLHFLLQKERQENRAMKKKTEEMRSKIHSLRTKKMELDRRLLEMESTIDSLKDEHKTLESALEERQNEIKLQRDAKMELEKENHQIATLVESLKQKEAEIEELKHRLEHSVKIWPLSTDDPLIPEAMNFTMPRNTTNVVKIGIEDAEKWQESSNYYNGVNSKGGKGSGGASTELRNGDQDLNILKRGKDTADRRQVSTEVQSSDQEKSIKGFSSEAEKGKADRDQNTSNVGKGNARNQQEVSHRSSIEGGMKLEMEDSAQSADSWQKKKDGHFNRTKGKRWRTLARNRRLEKHKNQEETVSSHSIFTGREFNSENENGSDRTNRKLETHAIEVEAGGEGLVVENNPLKVNPEASLNKLVKDDSNEGHVMQAVSQPLQNREGISTDGSRDEGHEHETPHISGNGLRGDNTEMQNKYNIASDMQEEEELNGVDVDYKTEVADEESEKDVVSDSEDKEEYKEETDF